MRLAAFLGRKIEMQRALMALFQLFSLEKAAEYLLKICVQNSAHIEIRILTKKTDEVT